VNRVHIYVYIYIIIMVNNTIQMSDYLKSMSELRRLKMLLYRGGQRELARRMDVMPNKIANGFDGFIRDVSFLERLRNETKKLIEERGRVLAH
jgi:hypothetical protein